MIIKEFDQVCLKDGRRGHICEILVQGGAYLMDVDLPGPDWDTIHIEHEQIAEIEGVPIDYKNTKEKGLKTPFGAINMYKNGQSIEFEAMCIYKFTNSSNGLYKLYPDMKNLKIGDVIICEFDNGFLQYDGVGERMINIVGTYNGYIIGMGTTDSQEIDDHDSREERVLSYENYGKTERGFEIHIIDNPEKHLYDYDFQKICFIVAWENEITENAWNIVSYVTS